jgi:hypothetical protein
MEADDCYVRQVPPFDLFANVVTWAVSTYTKLFTSFSFFLFFFFSILMLNADACSARFSHFLLALLY